jgi:hypothetical protein
MRQGNEMSLSSLQSYISVGGNLLSLPDIQVVVLKGQKCVDR